MANPAYPTLPQFPPGSKRMLRDGRNEDPTGDGSMRVRKLHADKYDFTITHAALNAADLATLTAFYGSNSAAPTIDFVWQDDGQTYVVRFGKDAIEPKWVSPLYHDVVVRLVAV